MTQTYVCSDFIARLLRLGSNQVSLKDFLKKVHEDYRDSFNDNLRTCLRGEVCKSRLLMHTSCGLQWIIYCIAGQEKNEGVIRLFGDI